MALIDGKYSQVFDDTFSDSERFSRFYSTEGSLLDSKGDVDAEGIEGPEGITDIGDIGGLLGSGTNHSGIAGSLADRALGTHGMLSGAFNAAIEYGKTKDSLSALSALAPVAISTVSRLTGVPADKAVGILGSVSNRTKQGMSVEDSFLGTLADLGLDIGIGMIGSALLGPVGALLGGVLGPQINIASVFDGFTEAASDWGIDAQAEANIAANRAMQAMGLSSLLGEEVVTDPEALASVMSNKRTSSISEGLKYMKEFEEFSKRYGSTEGYGGLGGIQGYGQYDDGRSLGLGQEGAGLGGGIGGDQGGTDGVGGSRGSGNEGSSDPGGRGGY